MATGYEVEYYQYIRNIDMSLNRIANCMEANEKREREKPEYSDVSTRSGTCTHPACREPVIVMINGQHWCMQHIDSGFHQIRATIDALEAGGIVPTPLASQ
jgi:hypothetical protein